MYEGIYVALMAVLFIMALSLWIRHRHTISFETITVVSLLTAVVFALEAVVSKWNVPEISTAVVSILFLGAAASYYGKTKMKSNSYLLRMVAKSSPYGAAVVSRVLYPAIREMDKKKAQLEKDIDTVRLIRDKMRDRFVRLRIEESHFKEHTKEFLKEKNELLKDREEFNDSLKNLRNIKQIAESERIYAEERKRDAEDKLSKIGTYEQRMDEIKTLSKVLEDERSALHQKMDELRKEERKVLRQKKRLGREKSVKRKPTKVRKKPISKPLKKKSPKKKKPARARKKVRGR
ncbi:MAG: hypothetical protein ABIB71_06845 [Candidatus Woesearchaeota archaeon]